MNLRGRLVIAVALATILVGGGLLMERVVEVRPVAAGASASTERSGVWYCPHGGGTGSRAWVTLANPGQQGAEVRLATFSRRDPPVRTRIAVPPGTHRIVEVPATTRAAASAVDFFGAPLVASVVVEGNEGTGLAAEPCATRGAGRWHVAELSTERGEGASLVVMNPFAAPAVVDVTLVAPERQVRADRLEGVVIPPERSTAFDLERVALGEEAVAALVEAGLGIVVAAGVGSTEDGLRLSLGSARLARRWHLPAAGNDAVGELRIVAGEREVPFRARVQGVQGQVEAVEEASVPAGRTTALEVEGMDASLVVSSEGAAAMAVGRRVRRSSTGDEAGTSGTPAAGERWVVLPPVPPGGGRQLLVVQNVGSEAATAAVRLLSAAGPLPGPGGGSVTVDAGRSRVVELTPEEGGEPVAVLVEGPDASLVVAGAGVTEAGYSLALGVRLDPLRVP